MTPAAWALAPGLQSVVLARVFNEREKANSVYDVIIVGGGPAGLSAALVLGRSCRKVLVIDAAVPRNTPARKFSGYLGYDGRSPQELLAQGREEIARYGVERREDIVTAARGCDCGFEVETKSGEVARCRKLLLATGVYDKLPDIPGLEECFGITVHHCPYCDGYEHRDQRLIAVGKNAAKAAGLALSLFTWSKNVIALSNGDELSDDYCQRLTKLGIAYCQRKIARIVHDEGKIRYVELADGERVEGDAVFFNSGERQQSHLAAMLGISYDSEATVREIGKQRSEVPGIFVAGDLDGDLQMVIVAAAEGAIAAVAINCELQGEDRCEAS